MYLGAHVRASGGVWKAVEQGRRPGAEAIQFFAGSPRTWKPHAVQARWTRRSFREARAASPIRYVVIHTIYLINLATAQRGVLREVGGSPASAPSPRRSSSAPTPSSRTSARIRAPASRPASTRVQVALSRALERGLRLQRPRPARGHGRRGRHHGRELPGARRDDRLGRRRPQVGLCLDTCHLLAAGYDIRTRTASMPPLTTLDHAGAAWTASRCCTSTTRRRRSAPTATATPTSARASIGLDGFRDREPSRLRRLPGILSNTVRSTGHIT